MTLTLHTDRKLIRAQASSTRYILARITAPSAERREGRSPINVGLVLDRSGSMDADRKFGLARDAVELALRMLRSDDRFSLVVYDNQIDVLAPSTRATPDAKRSALDALTRVHPRGSTNLGGGWLTGCEQVAEFLEDQRVSRCLLLTDGLANQGITDRDELARHAGELRRRGVATSTFGVGADFDERLLRDMAHEGGGNFYFIEGASQIPEMLTGELGEALEITLRSASIVVKASRETEVESLNRFRQSHVHDRGELRVELGDLTSAQQLDVVMRVTLPRGEVGREASADVWLLSAGELVAGGDSRMTWTYAGHEENDVQPRNREVDRVVAELYAARARAEATEANRAGDFARGEQVLERTARRITGYAGNDETLQRIARMLREDVGEFGAPMSIMALKARTFAAEALSKGRDTLGRARKNP